MRFTFSARRVSDIKDVWGDGVEVLRGVVQPVYHSLHAFLVVLYDWWKERIVIKEEEDLEVILKLRICKLRHLIPFNSVGTALKMTYEYKDLHCHCKRRYNWRHTHTHTLSLWHHQPPSQLPHTFTHIQTLSCTHPIYLSLTHSLTHTHTHT